MSDNLKYVRKLLKDAKAEGMIFRCFYDDPEEPDYLGDDTKEALEALTACDCMYLRLVKLNTKPDGKKYVYVGQAFIIPDGSNEPEEVIADLSSTGWLNTWWEANVGAAI